MTVQRACDPVPCWIYRSKRHAEMYLYLAGQDRFECVPDELLRSLGQLELALELELTPARRLAREDVVQVIENLHARGFHLQLPPPKDPRRYDA